MKAKGAGEPERFPTPILFDGTQVRIRTELEYGSKKQKREQRIESLLPSV
jgi:hypothetical protein